MAERNAGVPLASILWILAAVAAWIGVGMRYYRGDEIGWAWAVAGLAFLAMGINAWNRSRRTASRPGGRDRDPAA